MPDRRPDRRPNRRPDRRSVVRAAAGAAAAVPLAGCGDENPKTEGPFSNPAQSSGANPRTTPLVPVSQVPVGGAAFINAVDVPGAAVPNGVVVTQPKKGEFHAFSRDCSHQHCAVSDVRDGNIHCFCHGSLYDLATGQVVGGPAPKRLAKVPIKVKDDGIYRA